MSFFYVKFENKFSYIFKYFFMQKVLQNSLSRVFYFFKIQLYE